MGDENYDLAKREWDFVEQNQVLASSTGQLSNYILPIKTVKEMLLEHARDHSVRVECTAVKSSQDLTIFSRIIRFLFGPALLDSSQLEETKLFIKLSQIGIDSISDEHQMQLLTTLYFNLLDVNPSSRFGSHWQNIGFQGRRKWVK